MTEAGKFLQDLSKIIDALEDLTIEKEAYFDAIVNSGKINIPELERQAADAKFNPEKRQEVRQRYAQLRQQLSDDGFRAYALALSRDLPKNEKPN